MSIELKLRCRCGKVTGRVRDVAPNRLNRAVCYCKFCQAYAKSLDAADAVLDDEGGTEVLNVSPATIEITEGIEHVACGRLTSKGAMRWYASCCNTPFANTMAKPGIPFIGLVKKGCVDPASIPEPEDAHLGPVRARVNHTFDAAWAKEHRGTRGALYGMLVRFTPKLIGWRLGGAHRRFPVFDQDGQPIVTPHRLEWQK